MSDVALVVARLILAFVLQWYCSLSVTVLVAIFIIDVVYDCYRLGDVMYTFC